MVVTVAELEQAISNKLTERQDFLDKANALTGALAILNGLLAEAKKVEQTGIIGVNDPKIVDAIGKKRNK